MEYLHYDLGTVNAGSMVVAQLSGTESNVQLVDSTNLEHYRRRQDFHYYGGHFTRSPAHIRVPSTGHWHLVIDLGGYAGQLNASVDVRAA